jgi:hypothetical protein
MTGLSDCRGLRVSPPIPGVLWVSRVVKRMPCESAGGSNRHSFFAPLAADMLY